MVDRPQERRFPGARLPEDRRHAAGRQGQRHVVQNLQIAEALGEIADDHFSAGRRAFGPASGEGGGGAGSLPDRRRAGRGLGAQEPELDERRAEGVGRRIAQRAPGVMALDVILNHRKRAQDDEIPDRRHHQQRDHLQIAAVDDLDGVE